MINRLCAMLVLLASVCSLESTTLRAAPPADRIDYGRTSDSSSATQDNGRYRRYMPANIRSASNMQEEIDRPPAWTDYVPQADRFADSMMGPPPEFDDDYCGPPCQAGWSACPRRGPIYVRGEYLLWWVKGDSVPALVTTSPPTVTRAQAGVLGQPGTTVLFGDERLNQTARSGGRVVLGWWLDPRDRIEGDFFMLGQANAGFDQTSGGTPILARPFFKIGRAHV